MTFIKYEERRLSKAGREMVDQANTILAELAEQGYTLSLRQLFYQFVSRNWIANTEKSYKRLGDIISKGRLGGLISWTAIEDRNRGLLSWGFTETPEDVLNGIEYTLSLDLWKRQENYVEVWVEKDALIGVVATPCDRLKTPYMACKGYLSLSEGWSAGNRFLKAIRRGQNPVLIYLGDHDPSGLHMTVNHMERQSMFAGHVDVRRLALNMDQVQEHGPPPNYAKLQDSRTPAYVAEYGETCWELDALQPSVIDKLITDEVDSLRDEKVWAETLEEQKERRKLLAGLGDNWPTISRYLEKKSAR